MDTVTLPPVAPDVTTGTLWRIDPAHSTVGFSIRHLKIATVHGRFNGYSGAIQFDGERPWDASVMAEIDAATIDTGIGKRDDHLRSADFFDVATWPTISFRSTRIRPATPRDLFRLQVIGDLTMHGVTRQLELAVKQTARPNAATIAFAASATLNRRDFGLNWSQVVEGGGLVVGDEVRIAITIQAHREAQ